MEHHHKESESPAPAKESVSQSQERQSEQGKAFIPLDNKQQAKTGWSWGAFLLGPFFVIAVRKYVFLFWYLLMLIPLVNIVVLPGLSIYLGIKGREMAAEAQTFANNDEYVGFMKGVDHAGKMLAVLYLILIAVFVVGIFSAVTLSSLGVARDMNQDEKIQDIKQLQDSQ